MADAPVERHQTIRIRRETRRRDVTVASTRYLTPNMIRIEFVSPELHDFDSAAPDDHVKLFLADEAGEVCARDYTPRLFDPAAGRLTIDFAVHDAGPATRWALAAKTGDTIQIGGPRGSRIVADDFDWYLLIGDETALPAIGRRIEGLRPDVPVRAIVMVETADDRQTFAARQGLDIIWLARADQPSGDADALLGALAAQPLPAGEGYVWIGAEASAARALRAYVTETLGHPREYCRASGYWSAAAPGTHEKFED